MTPVMFEFHNPDGTPLADTKFEIRLAKSGFLETPDGIVMPDTVEATTDADGKVTVALAPSSSLYYLKLLREDDGTEECCPAGIFYKFYVPDQPNPIRVQDLIMDPPPSTTAWDEAAMLIIVNAKAAAVSAAAEAKMSAAEAAASAEGMEDNASRAEAAAAAALESETNAGVSADEAEASKVAAGLSKDAAKVSEDSAAASAAAALASKSAAGTSETNALASANAASDSATVATNKANQTVADAANTAADRVAVSTDKNTVAAAKVTTQGYRNEAEQFRDEAQEALGTLTGVISDGGAIDLSSNTYPPKPTVSTVWRVTVGGIISGVDYKLGDQLFFTKAGNYFYKVDSTDDVFSVAGRKGAVVLNKVDVGLENVDNTSDANKPVSTAQKAANDAQDAATTTGLALKVNKTEADAKFYARNNVVGPASQAGGIPTGAIIEYTNAAVGNGGATCIRFADGTQICTRTGSVSAVAMTSAIGPLFTHTGNFIDGTTAYLKPFLSGSQISFSISVLFSSWYGFAQPTGGVGHIAWPSMKAFALATTNSDITYTMISIGRWY